MRTKIVLYLFSVVRSIYLNQDKDLQCLFLQMLGYVYPSFVNDGCEQNNWGISNRGALLQQKFPSHHPSKIYASQGPLNHLSCTFARAHLLIPIRAVYTTGVHPN